MSPCSQLELLRWGGFDADVLDSFTTHMHSARACRHSTCMHAIVVCQHMPGYRVADIPDTNSKVHVAASCPCAACHAIGALSCARVSHFVGRGMLFQLSLLRAIHGTMLGAGGAAAAAPPVAPPPPPAARTRITHVPGDPTHRVEDRWQLPGTCPMVTSFPFLR